MSVYIYLAYFLAGAFGANALPHLVNGISGRSFPKRFPFKTPETPNTALEQWLFSPVMNVIWGIVNVTLGYILLHRVGNFSGGITLDMLSVAAGFSCCSIFLAWNFGRVHTKASGRK